MWKSRLLENLDKTHQVWLRTNKVKIEGMTGKVKALTKTPFD